jgi:hypothetical protein
MSKGANLSTVLGQVAKKALWAPPTVFAVHYLVTEWLDHEPYVDPVMHFVGGAAMALLFYYSITGWQRYRGRLAVEKSLFLAFGLTVFVAVAWEVMEYFLLVYDNYAEGWELLNTLRDLALGAGGAALLLDWLRRR